MSENLTVGKLRELIADLPDETPIAIKEKALIEAYLTNQDSKETLILG